MAKGKAKKVDEGKKADLAVVGEGQEDGQVVEHAEVRETILNLLKETENKTWDLGVAMEMAYSNDMYRSWGFESWKKYVEDELQIHIRKAQFLLKLQKWFKDMPSQIQEWIRGLGWTKARMLMHAVTVENAAEWRDKVEGKTVSEIDKMLKEAKVSGELEEEEGEDGDGGKKKEDVAKKKSFSLFPQQDENVDRALDKAMEISGSEKPGNNLDLICTEFLANNVDINSVQEHLKAQERMLGLKIVAYSEAEDRIVFGSDLIKAMEEMDKRDEARETDADYADQ